MNRIVRLPEILPDLLRTLALTLMFWVGPEIAAAQAPTAGAQLSAALSLTQAEQELYGLDLATESTASSTNYTQSLLLVNRSTTSAPDPSAKYWVIAQLETDDGRRLWFSDSDWRHMPSGEVDDGQFYQKKLRVVRVRFHWRDALILGDRYKSEWVEASSGKYLWLVILQWQGADEWLKPIRKIERPLPVETELRPAA